MIVSINGKLLPLDEARISPLDRGFLLGEGIFETILVREGIPLFIEEHLLRFRKGASLIGVSLSFSDEEIASSISALLEANRLGEAYLRLTLSSGPKETEEKGEPTFLIFARQFEPHPQALYEKGVSVIISRSVRRNIASPLPRIKSTSYLENLLARKEAKGSGAFEAILLNERGEVAEGSCTNLFAVSGGLIFTPPLEANILAGVTRRVLLELFTRENFAFQERFFLETELREADEIFITNSLIGILPVSSLDASPVGEGRPGAITQKLSVAYERYVQDYLRRRR